MLLLLTAFIGASRPINLAIGQINSASGFVTVEYGGKTESYSFGPGISGNYLLGIINEDTNVIVTMEVPGFCSIKVLEEMVSASVSDQKDIYIRSSMLTEDCKPHQITINFNDIPSEFVLGYKKGDSSITQITSNPLVLDGLKSTDSIDLYLVESTGCQNNYDLQKKFEAKLSGSYSFGFSEIPQECIKYQISIDFETGIPSDYKFGYKFTDSEIITEIQSSPLIISDLETARSIKLVLISSPSCQPNHVLDETYTAGFSSTYRFSINDIPDECSPNYFVAFDLSKLKEGIDAEIYYIIKDDFIKVISNQQIIQKSEFTVYLYAKTKYCDEYVKLYAPHYEFEASKTFETVSIEDSDIPEKCLNPLTYISAVNNFNDPAIKLCYKDVNGFSCPETIYLDNYGTFSVDIYYSSLYCNGPEYNFIRKIESKEIKQEEIFTQDDIKDECKTRYDLCVKILDDFKYSYTLPNDIDIKVTETNTEIQFTSKQSYSIPFKLEHKKCKKPKVSFSFEMTPEPPDSLDSCRYPSVNYSCSYGGLGTGAIVGIVIGCVAAIAIIVVVVIIIIKKKKSQDMSKSEKQDDESV